MVFSFFVFLLLFENFNSTFIRTLFGLDREENYDALEITGSSADCIFKIFENSSCDSLSTDETMLLAIKLYNCYAPHIGKQFIRYKHFKNIKECSKKMKKDEKITIKGWIGNIPQLCMYFQQESWIRKADDVVNKLKDLKYQPNDSIYETSFSTESIRNYSTQSVYVLRELQDQQKTLLKNMELFYQEQYSDAKKEERNIIQLINSHSKIASILENLIANTTCIISSVNNEREFQKSFELSVSSDIATEENELKMIDNSVKKVKEEGEKARVNLVCLRENAKELLNESSLVLEQLNIILKIEKDSAENTQNATNSVQKMKNDLNISQIHLMSSFNSFIENMKKINENEVLYLNSSSFFIEEINSGYNIQKETFSETMKEMENVENATQTVNATLEKYRFLVMEKMELLKGWIAKALDYSFYIFRYSVSIRTFLFYFSLFIISQFLTASKETNELRPFFVGIIIFGFFVEILFLSGQREKNNIKFLNSSSSSSSSSCDFGKEGEKEFNYFSSDNNTEDGKKKKKNGNKGENDEINDDTSSKNSSSSSFNSISSYSSQNSSDLHLSSLLISYSSSFASEKKIDTEHLQNYQLKRFLISSRETKEKFLRVVELTSEVIRNEEHERERIKGI